VSKPINSLEPPIPPMALPTMSISDDVATAHIRDPNSKTARELKKVSLTESVNIRVQSRIEGNL
jgi:hypothetical protein